MSQGLPRIHLLELFAGEAAISRSFTYFKFRACPVDIAYNERFDMASNFGFLVALTLLLRVASRVGLLWQAPVCTTFVWLASSSHLRNCVFPEGERRRCDVRLGTILANRSMALAQIADMRLVSWCLEQPSSSVMPSLRRFQNRFGSRPTVYCNVYSLIEFGGETSKPVRTMLFC